MEVYFNDVLFFVGNSDADNVQLTIDWLPKEDNFYSMSGTIGSTLREFRRR